MPRSPKEVSQSIVKTLGRKTGKTLEQWIELVRKSGPKERDDQVDWLKVKHRLNNVQAKAIVKMMNEGLADYDEKLLAELHFSNGKEYLKPVFEKLILSVKKWGELTVTMNKTYLSLVNSEQFAILKSTKDGLIVGVPGSAVKAMKNKNFVRVKNFGNQKISHKILLIDESDVTDGVLKVLKSAYQKF